MSAVKKLYLFFLFALVMTAMPSTAAGQSDTPNTPNTKNVTPLSNKDIVVMVDRKIEAQAIIQTIKSSPCTFDTFPPLLREMKRRGVPDEVLQAMVEAPYGPSLQSRANHDENGDEPIYHYADQLKQMGFISPVNPSRRYQSNRRTRTARRVRN